MKIIFRISELAEASDYRGFLSILYSTNKKKSAQFSYAYIAKQCGFLSKSFVKEVIDGKKKMSLESAHKLIEGLSLPVTLGKYFLCLVSINDGQNNDRKNRQGSATAEKELKRLRQSLLGKKAIITTNNEDKVFANMHWPIIYAALGSQEKGATLLEILQRTGLSETVILSTLNFMISELMISQKGRRYFVMAETAFFENLGKSQFFKKYYLQALSRLSERAQKNFSSQEELFYAMSMSINKAKIAEFRQDLSELLDKYTTEIEEPHGDRVASLVCGLTLN